MPSIWQKSMPIMNGTWKSNWKTLRWLHSPACKEDFVSLSMFLHIVFSILYSRTFKKPWDTLDASPFLKLRVIWNVMGKYSCIMCPMRQPSCWTSFALTSPSLAEGTGWAIRCHVRKHSLKNFFRLFGKPFCLYPCLIGKPWRIHSNIC